MQPNYKTWGVSCWECGEVITNPVCPECLAGEMEDWLALKQPELIPSVRQMSKAVGEKEYNSTTCILCGARIDTCTYCFVQDIIDLLQKRNPELVDSFLERFSYDDTYNLVPEEILAMQC